MCRQYSKAEKSELALRQHCHDSRFTIYHFPFTTLSGVLPAGASFPYDFGYLPSTRGEDGDPIDVLLLMDDPAFVGCLVPARLLGVIEAEQTERTGETMRNDRLIAVAEASITHRHLKSLGKLDENLLQQIEHFFISYNAIKGKQFKPLSLRDAPRRHRAHVLHNHRLNRFYKLRPQRSGNAQQHCFIDQKPIAPVRQVITTTFD